MSKIILRDVDPAMTDRLRLRAEQHGISIEDEVKQLLAVALQAPAGPKPSVPFAVWLRTSLRDTGTGAHQPQAGLGTSAFSTRLRALLQPTGVGHPKPVDAGAMLRSAIPATAAPNASGALDRLRTALRATGRRGFVPAGS